MFSIWQWIKKQIMQKVPPEIGLCEFDCYKLQCTQQEWQVCPRRIAKAAGELMPAIKVSSAGNAAPGSAAE